MKYEPEASPAWAGQASESGFTLRAFTPGCPGERLQHSLRYNGIFEDNLVHEVVEFDDTTKVDNPATMVRDERIVVAFHGTSDDRAAAIVASGAFTPSKNDYDWLGHGVYFWEYAPLRAWQWARRKYREHAAVVEASVGLGFCLDLSDIRYTSALRLAYENLREAFIKSGKPLPINRNKARCLDCLVVNYLGTYILPECDTVRGPFLEGDPVYDGSMLLSQSHVQSGGPTPELYSWRTEAIETGGCVNELQVEGANP